MRDIGQDLSSIETAILRQDLSDGRMPDPEAQAAHGYML